MDQNLRVPGPTPLPSDVRDAQAAPMINHRGPEFGEMLREISAGWSSKSAWVTSGGLRGGIRRYG